jgi:molybdopterin-guanine dinucleotide biosynthesis protein A
MSAPIRSGGGAGSCAGIVLAGGRSTRMGRDKALLVMAGETLVARAVRRLRAVCAETAVADGGRRLLAGVESLPDGPGAGPAAGILGAAARFPGRPLLVVACDLPDLPIALLAALAQAPAPEALVVPRWAGGIEPLCARYGASALAALARRVEAGEMALHPLAESPGVAVRFLEGGELAAFGDPAVLFHNLNRPEDLEGVEG